MKQDSWDWSKMSIYGDKPEETPVMYPSENDSKEPDSGNMACCYLCGKDLSQLPENTHVKRDFRTVVDSMGVPSRTYVLSYCIWCVNRYITSDL